MRPFAEWLRRKGRQYAGKWVALDETGQCIDSDAARLALQRRLRERGRLRGVVITLVPGETR
jgi:ABC-type phosphate transport system auxiliary subunit